MAKSTHNHCGEKAINFFYINTLQSTPRLNIGHWRSIGQNRVCNFKVKDMPILSLSSTTDIRMAFSSLSALWAGFNIRLSSLVNSNFHIWSLFLLGVQTYGIVTSVAEPSSKVVLPIGDGEKEFEPQERGLICLFFLGLIYPPPHNNICSVPPCTMVHPTRRCS